MNLNKELEKNTCIFYLHTNNYLNNLTISIILILWYLTIELIFNYIQL